MEGLDAAMAVALPAGAGGHDQSAGREATPLFAAALLDCLRRLQPCPDEETGAASFSPRELVVLLRQRLPPGVLEAGSEHDSAEALEQLIDTVREELRHCFMHNSSRQLAAQGALDLLLKDLTKEAGGGSDLGGSREPGGRNMHSSTSEPAGDSGHLPAPDQLLHVWRHQLALPCEGSLSDEIQCLKCGHRFSLQLTPFYALQLSMPLAPGQTVLGDVRVARGATLATCLHSFFGYEMLSDVTCTRCSVAGTLQAAAAAYGGSVLPPCLQRLQEALGQPGGSSQAANRSAPVLLPDSDAYEAAVRDAGGRPWSVFSLRL